MNVLDRDAAVRFLSSRIDYERTLAVPYGDRGFKLDRMRELLRRLGNPERGMPLVHVAGSKGKGSTATMIGSILTASGRRTGLFTSPHLDRVEQRIAVDREPCSSRELVELVETIQPAVAAMDAAESATQRAVGKPAHLLRDHDRDGDGAFPPKEG